MSEADRIAKLEERVAALEGRSGSIDRTERELLEAARQWARMKQLGHYLEDGLITRVGLNDRGDYEKHFATQMTRAALSLLDLEAKPRL